MQPSDYRHDEQRSTSEPIGSTAAAVPFADGAVARDGPVADDALREAMRGVLLHAVCAVRFADVADSDRRRLIQRLCGDVKLRGLRAEQLIIALKEAWYRLPEARRLQHPDSEDVLGAVITSCIEEYYGPFTRRRAN